MHTPPIITEKNNQVHFAHKDIGSEVVFLAPFLKASVGTSKTLSQVRLNFEK